MAYKLVSYRVQESAASHCDPRIPFYYLFKTIFLLFLALPQTQGSTFIYSMHLAPILRGHEDEIDSALAQIKLAVYEFIQDKLRAVWSQVAGGISAANSSGATAVPDVQAVNPPSMADPLSGAAQLVSGWWNTYAPAIAATGAAYIASRQQAAAATAQQRRPEPPKPQPQSVRPGDDRASVLARRRALEAELAALPQVSSPSPNKSVGESVAGESATSGLSSSSSYSLHAGEARRRKESGSDGEGDAGKYENIAKEDVGSGSEDNSNQENVNPRSSWWGWRTSSYGYERVKSD
jgi:receptor expression-enhancing protein 1/2/3/4